MSPLPSTWSDSIKGKDMPPPSIFSHQMEAIVLIILQIFFATCTVLKLWEYFWIVPSFSWGVFGQMMYLDQLRASKNI